MARVDAIVQKLLHPTAAIEALQVEVSGAKKPILQLATIVKASARSIEIIPKSSAFATPILVRLTKHDKALAPRKEDAKITLTLPPLTRQRRAHAQEEIKAIQTDLANRMRLLRKHALLHVQELGLGEDALRALALDVEARIEQGQSTIAQRMTDQIDELSGTADEEEDEAALDGKK
jgi:ribosome recycling factor